MKTIELIITFPFEWKRLAVVKYHPYYVVTVNVRDIIFSCLDFNTYRKRESYINFDDCKVESTNTVVPLDTI